MFALFALCARACTGYPASHRALLGRRTALETPRVHASYPAHIFHYAAVGTLVELSWKHAHGPGRAVLGASWVRDILRNLKHRAFLANAPHSRRPAVARTLRACIIVYMLYF